MTKNDTDTQASAIRAHFAATDSFDVEGMASFLSDHVELFFANNDPIEGKTAVEDFARQFFPTLKGMRHEIHDIWHAAEGPEVVICRMTVHYTKLDDGCRQRAMRQRLPDARRADRRGPGLHRYKPPADVTPTEAVSSGRGAWQQDRRGHPISHPAVQASRRSSTRG
jgi:ketosteroid isomerase-like protein